MATASGQIVNVGYDSNYGNFVIIKHNHGIYTRYAHLSQARVKKGQLVVVSGRLQMRDWEDKNGNKRTIAKVIADNVYFGERKQSTAEGATEKLKSVEFEDFDDDGELPF